MNRLGHALARPLFETVTQRSFNANGRLPLPPGEGHGHAHAPGPDSDHLLLVGTAAASGLGVITHELGLAGQLARRLSSLTHRGVDIESFGEPRMTAADCWDVLPSLEVGRFDAVILEIGTREAVWLQPVAEWRRELRRVIESALAAPLVFVIAVPPIPNHTRLPAAMGRTIMRKIAQLNAASRAIAEELDGVVFVPFPPSRSDEFEEFGSITFYEQWAENLAVPIATRLDPELHRSRLLLLDEPARQAALDEMGLVDSGPHPLVDDLVRVARGLLGAEAAAVGLIDHDRQWMLSVDGMGSGAVARTDALCDLTIRRPEILVIEDALRDERLANTANVVGGPRIRFYAGYPIEAPSGHRIGALCVIDSKPRTFSDTEAALLRDLALQAQALLWERARSHTLER